MGRHFPSGGWLSCPFAGFFLPIWILTQISILLNWYIFELVTVLNQSDEKVVQVVQLIQGFHFARLQQMRISEFPKNWVFAKIPWVFGEKSLSFCTWLSFWVKNCWVLLNHSVFKQFFLACVLTMQFQHLNFVLSVKIFWKVEFSKFCWVLEKKCLEFFLKWAWVLVFLRLSFWKKAK